MKILEFVSEVSEILKIKKNFLELMLGQKKLTYSKFKTKCLGIRRLTIELPEILFINILWKYLYCTTIIPVKNIEKFEE